MHSLSLSLLAIAITGIQARGRVSDPSKCHISGCSGELCLPVGISDGSSNCDASGVLGCYANPAWAICSPTAKGGCAWEQTADLGKCILEKTPKMTSTMSVSSSATSGCASSSSTEAPYAQTTPVVYASSSAAPVDYGNMTSSMDSQPKSVSLIATPTVTPTPTPENIYSGSETVGQSGLFLALLSAFFLA